MNLAAELARDRAIVVAVGTVGMELQRKLYYEKELDFRISRSYGPGRYDRRMSRKGAIIRLAMCAGPKPATWKPFCNSSRTANSNLPSLITHRFPMEQATRAYDLITGNTREFFLGTLITYAGAESADAPNCGNRIPVIAVSVPGRLP